MNILEDPLVQRFLDNRELSISSQVKYERVLRYYTDFIKLTPSEFISEAEDEEEDRIRMRKRKLTSYLLNWKTHLTNEGYKPQTIQVYILGIKTFYKDNDIELPIVRLKGIDRKENIDDIPSKQNIREALSHSNPKYTAVILLISSSGMGSNEIRSLKIGDLFNSLKEYIETPQYDLFDIGGLLDIRQRITTNNELIIPTWKNLTRQKTNVIFTTFSSPESLVAIIDYLKISPPKYITDPLFRSEHHKDKPIGERAFHDYFNRLNKKCDFPSPNGQVLFRSHAVGRKYFATTLYRNSIPQLSIEWMLAHKIDPTISAYYKQDTTTLKQQYITVVNDLSIADTKTHILKDEGTKKLESMEKEMEEMKEQFRILQQIKK